LPVLVHTSDVHVGAPLGWLGDRAAEQREQIRRTFASIVDLALEEKADCLLIAGDLFDSGVPPSSDVRLVLQEIGRFTSQSEGAAVILPGSHDSLGTSSVYTSYGDEFARVPRLFILGDDDRTTVDLAAPGVSVRGTALRSNRSTSHQLAGLAPSADLPFSVAVAHGSVNVVPVDPDDHPIELDELAARGWAYFALGHWHSWREIEGASAPAVYAGAPEIMAVDQTGAGYVAVVHLGTDGATVRKHRVGVRSVAGLAVDVGETADASAFAARVRETVSPDPDTILRLALSGLLAVDSGFDESTFTEAIRGDYFHVVPGDRTYHLRLDGDDLARLPERLVIGQFARLMKRQLDETTGEEQRREIEDALQLGVALLQGKDVLR
jgi:DNA repair exonuclease SbcCD nuclease subunit